MQYFELGCRRCDQSGLGRERHPLGEEDLRLRNRRGRYMADLTSLSISGLKPVLIRRVYGFLGRLLEL